MKQSAILLVLSVLFLTGFSQEREKYVTELESKAATSFFEGEYKLAYVKYYKLYLVDSTNIEYNYYYGISNVEANIAPEKAIKNLTYVRDKDKSKKEVIFYIAKAKMLCYKFKEAIELFNYYIGQQDDKELSEKAKQMIRSCENGIELLNNPVNVTFENLGKNINSRLDDYNPFVAPDESFILFTSNKKYDPDYGTYIRNIYRSDYNKGVWRMAVSQNKINTYDNEELLSLYKGGEHLFLRNHMDKEYSDILLANKSGKSYKYNKKYDNLFHVLNSKFIENGATSVSKDESFIISSNRPGGIGGSDLFIIRKLPNGLWGEAENLGNTINTPYDEAYPNLSADGNALYFASKGHNSIGGYDVFVSYWNITRQEWTKPLNLGYPINTSSNNTTISFTENKRYAYIASDRREGAGGQDIYRIIFEDIEEEYTLIKGTILIGDTINFQDFKGHSGNLEILVFDAYGNLYGQYLPKKNTGEFILILPIGEFELTINCLGYKGFNEKLVIYGKADYIKELEKRFYILSIN